MEEPLINLRPTTDFDKLVWEREINKLLCKQISVLKVEIGMLQAERDELNYKLNERQIQ